MSMRYPEGFKRAVVAVTHRGDLTSMEVATDFGIAEETVRRWMHQANIYEDIKDGMATSKQTELLRLRWEKSPLGD